MEVESVGVTEDYVVLAESNLTGDTWDGQVSVYHRLPGRVTPLSSAHQLHGVAEAQWWGASVVSICDNGDFICFPTHTLDNPKRVQAHHGLGTALAVTAEHLMTAAEEE